QIDRLLGGGLERGSSTLISGPSGVGKSSVACTFAAASANRRERVAFFIFDETRSTLVARCAGLGLGFAQFIESGLVSVNQVDPAQLSPGQFSTLVQRAVQEENAAVVIIDSLNGYLQSMPDERFLLVQLHELLTYLNQQGVVTLMITAQSGLIGPIESTVDASYLADTMIALRYFESSGRVRQAISVVKKRHGQHERTIRELSIVSGRGVVVGEPLVE